jgi:peptidoglycan L-alanyl-D-glutamate endopeptidase CwlK
MKLLEHQFIFWGHVFSLTNHAHQRGWLIQPRELQRTEYQQKKYVEEGKSKTMQSYHLKCLAIDLNFWKGGEWITDKSSLTELGEYWESLDPLNRWGGNWTFYDPAHFERRATEVWHDK